jgi:hypothetical protein
MIELLLPYGFDTLEYSWVKATIGICTLADYYVAKKLQHPCGLDGGWYPPGTSMGGLQRRSVGLSSGQPLRSWPRVIRPAFFCSYFLSFGVAVIYIFIYIYIYIYVYI